MMRPMTMMLALLIMFVPNQLHFPTTFGAPGLNAFNLLFLLALLMVMMQTATRSATAGHPHAPLPSMTAPLLIYYFILGLAVINGVAGGTANLYEDLAIYKTAVTYSMLYFIAYYGVHELRAIRFLVGVLLFMLAITSLEAIKEGIEYGFGGYAHDQRASGPFGHGSGQSNYAGVFYGIFSTFALGIALFARELRPLYRLVALGCYGLGCIAILATFSRQSFLIIGVTTLLIALRRNPLLAVIAVAGMLAYPLWAPEGVVDRIDMTTEETTTGETELENSAASRYELWDAAMILIEDHPLGIGFNQFQEDVEPYLPGWVLARDAQNQYLLVWAEAGFAGLLAFLFVLFSLYGIGRRLKRDGPTQEAKALGMTMKVTIVAVAMGNIYSSTFFSGEVMGAFWLLAGLLSKYHFLAQHETEEIARPSFAATPVERARAVYARWQRRAERTEAGS